MTFAQTINHNLLSPELLFFALGIVAGLCKSDLKIPGSVSRYLAIYLMLAIGFKGGVSIANMHDLNGTALSTIIAGLIAGLLQPFLGYALLRLTTRIDNITASAVAAHYGSTSIVTFATAKAFLESEGITYSGYLIAVLALMEAPAIFSGLFIAHQVKGSNKNTIPGRKLILKIFTNSAILLLFGTFLIGYITGDSGMNKLGNFFSGSLYGMLSLFLLDMGLSVSKNFHQIKSFSFPLMLFGIYMPLIGGGIGIALSYFIGLDVGTATLFTVLCASASYIAVPAAMRLSLPEAKEAIYLPLSLSITFPFNITLGIPLYYLIINKLL